MSTIKQGQQIRQIIYGTIQHFITGFIVERRSRGLVEGTIEYYFSELEGFANFLDLLGVVQLEEITPDLIRKYLLQLSKTRNEGGVHASFRAIRAFFNWYENEFEPDNWKNPIRKVKPKSPSKEPLPGVSLGEFNLLIDACYGQWELRDRVSLMFLLDTGCRAAEFCSLNLGDVDLVTGSIVIKHGKGDKRRVVFIGRVVLRELRRYLKTRGNLKAEAPLFVNDENERVKYGGLLARIRRISKKAGIAAPGLHDFRRAFAINMLRNGVDVITLSRLMGHSSLEVTKRYLHQIEEDLRQAHAKGSPVDNQVKG